MKRVVAVLVVLAVVLAAVLTGLWALDWGQDEGASSSGRVAAPERTANAEAQADPDEVKAPPHADLYRYYQQKISWSPCPDNDQHECGTLEVPIDYQQPRGDTFKLNLLKVPAGDQDKRVGSLVVNPGGPGAPGTQYAAVAGSAFTKPLLKYFDIVGFDPRGTGKSNPVDCLSDEQLDQYLSGDPDPDTAAEEADFDNWLSVFAKGCVERSDALIAHVTTAETARDMDVLRAALGEVKLDYFGASYGTKLGATYAELFPSRVGHLVLDGAVDVGLDSRTLSLDQAAGFETALRAYVQNCIDSTDSCFLGDSVDEGLAKIKGLLDDIDQKPLSTGTDRDLTVGLAFYGVVTPLYNRDYWYMLSSALKGALKGDGSQLLMLADLYASREGDTYTDNSAEAIFAINCLDDPWAISPDEVADQYPDFEKASPTFGRVFAWGLTGCRDIQVTSSEPDREIRGAGADPILVIGTTRDPATPMKWAVALADQLDSGVLIERDGDGHTGFNAGNACVDKAVEDYLLDGTVPEDGLKC